MTPRQIWLSLGELGVLIALLELAYWLNTGARAGLELLDSSAGQAWSAEYNLRGLAVLIQERS